MSDKEVGIGGGEDKKKINIDNVGGDNWWWFCTF